MNLTIEMGGKPRSFHFGNGFIGNSLERLGVSITELFEKLAANPYKLTPILMYESYKFNLWMKGETDDVTQDDFVRWTSEVPDFEDGPMNKWMIAFTQSRTKHVANVEESKGKKGKPKPVKK